MSSLVLSGGVDGKACIYDINRKVMVNHVHYSSSVTTIRWLPLDVNSSLFFALQCTRRWQLGSNSILSFQMDPTGNQVILGYADGVVRLFALESETDPSNLALGSTSSVYRLTKALAAR